MTLPFKVEYSRRPKTEMVDYVSVNGKEWEFHSLLELLQETRDSTIEIQQNISALKELDIVKSKGSRWNLSGAKLGSQGDEFIKELEHHQKELWDAEGNEKSDD